MISVHFQGKPFNIMVIQANAPTSNAKEAEVEWFYEDLQDLFELTPKKDVLFIIGDWNTKVGSLFTLLIVSFDVQKLLRLVRSHLFIFAFISNILGGGS